MKYNETLSTSTPLLQLEELRQRSRNDAHSLIDHPLILGNDPAGKPRKLIRVPPPHGATQPVSCSHILRVLRGEQERGDVIYCNRSGVGRAVMSWPRNGSEGYGPLGIEESFPACLVRFPCGAHGRFGDADLEGNARLLLVMCGGARLGPGKGIPTRLVA